MKATKISILIILIFFIQACSISVNHSLDDTVIIDVVNLSYQSGITTVTCHIDNTNSFRCMVRFSISIYNSSSDLIKVEDFTIRAFKLREYDLLFNISTSEPGVFANIANITVSE